MILTDIITDFRNKIGKGAVFGPFSKSADPAIIESTGHAGFDFIILDLEHGPNNTKGLQDLVRAAQITGILPIVRVKEKVPSLIGEVLDIGAGGIQVPQISCADDVREVIELARFSPLGMRGVCCFVRAAGYSSIEKKRYFKEANNALIIIQLEGEEAINNIDEILEVKGFDIVFIGPYDLSQSLGVPGEVDNPIVVEKMRQIVEKCKKKKILVGNFTDTLEDAEKWINMDVRYISYSVDIGIYYNACRRILKNLR
jgi:4-hydroxy-2-oxoheptanedioate aldolase